jgi:hypothetical protein
MHKPLRTLLLASLLCLPGALFARTTPFVQPTAVKNVFAAWTPNQLVSTQNTVDLYIKLPYEGYHNDWTVSFSSSEGYYSFETSSSTNPDHNLYPLGSIPEGTYAVTLTNHNSRDAWFEFILGCNNNWVRGQAYSKEYTAYNVSITDGCNEIYADVM